MNDSKQRSGRRFLEERTDALYSILGWNGGSKGGRQLPKGERDENSAGRLGLGRRLMSMGKGAGSSKEYRPGFGWHSIFLFIALPAVLALTLAPRQILEQIPGFPQSRSPIDHGELIVVSARGSHREAVTATAKPRGYSVRTAGGAEAAISAIDSSERIGLVVIDRDQAGAGEIQAAVRAKFPAARIITLPESATKADIANQLIQGGLR